MKKHIAIAAMAISASFFALSGAQAECVSEPCYKTVTKQVRGEQIGTKEVPVYRWHTQKVKQKVPCTGCEQPKAELVKEPEPETVRVKKKIIVIEEPVIEYRRLPQTIVQPRPMTCCPPGGRQTWLPPCASVQGGTRSMGTYGSQKPTHLGEAACLRVGGVRYVLEGSYHRCYNGQGQRLSPTGSVISSR
ncbi:MAG: hypothetical protein WC829_24165 [Hyphomicrobium sp.]|jgi:hypothetical protein